MEIPQTCVAVRSGAKNRRPRAANTAKRNSSEFEGEESTMPFNRHSRYFIFNISTIFGSLARKLRMNLYIEEKKTARRRRGTKEGAEREFKPLIECSLVRKALIVVLFCCVYCALVGMCRKQQETERANISRCLSQVEICVIAKYFFSLFQFKSGIE